MDKYHKIQTMFDRDLKNKSKTVIAGQFSKPEFKFLELCEWEITEKVNGTNVRILWDGETARYAGKTDNSQLPSPLIRMLSDTFTANKMKECLSGPVCLYGEGYGPGIHKGGGNYRTTPGFALFDIRVDNWWLTQENVTKISKCLGMERVPIIAYETLTEAFLRCSAGFDSWWGDFRAEGIVARPAGCDLFNRKGERIITKLKCKDF